MGVMQPWGLWALAAIAPIVIAYLLRMPRARLAVPHAAPWLRLTAADRRISNERRTLISLAIVLAAALALIVALARPYVAAGGEPRHRIVVVDCSRSMRACDATTFRALDFGQRGSTSGPSRMQRAIARAQKIASAMTPDDRLTLIAAGARPAIVASAEREPTTIDRAIAGLQARDERADLPAACALAVELAKAAEHPEVVVISDGSIGRDDLEPLARLRSDAGQVVFARVGKPCDNVGIARMKARRMMDSDADVEAIVTVASSCREKITVPVSLSLDARALDATDLEVPANGEATAVFRVQPRLGGVLTARLRVQDALPDDDQAMDWLPPPRRLAVALVRREALSGQALEDYYLSTILKCDAGIAPGFLSSDAYLDAAKDRKALRQLDAVVFDGWAPEHEEDLPPCHCLFIGCESPALPVTVKRALDKPLIRRWNAGHPLMSELDLRNVFLAKAKEVEAQAPDEDAVVDLVGSPLALAREVGGRKVAYLAFDPQDSDIRFRKELPLLVFNVFEWFKRGPEPVTQVAPGEPITLAWGDAPWHAITVLPPSGAPQVVPVTEGAGSAVFTGTAAPGVYRWLGESERSPQRGFAVVFQDVRESRLDVVEAPVAGERDAKGAVAKNRIAAEDATAVSGASVAGGRWWIASAWSALATLLVEAWLYHRRIFF